MVDEPKNQPETASTPEQELVELLRRSGAKQSPGRPQLAQLSGMVAAPPVQPSVGGMTTRRLSGINWLAVAIGGLTLVLVFATGYFLWSGLKFNTGEITLELNQERVNLEIDGETKGEVSSGYSARLKTGSHQVQLSKDGFLSLEKTVVVERKDKLLLTFQLLPIPAIEKVLDGTVKYVRLSQDGSEISYWDTTDNNFKSWQLASSKAVTLFRGSFPSLTWATWAPINEIVIAKLTGRHQLGLMVDNREIKGRYVVLGERPVQGASKYDGTTTWLFNDDRRNAAGWEPVLLSESIRQIAFGPGGREVVYIYDTADGEYSLVRALADGQEWERVVTDLPRVGTDAVLSWSSDEQHVLIDDSNKLWLADLHTHVVNEIATDRLPDSHYSFSPGGDQLAYLVQDGEGLKLMIYDLVTNEVRAIDDINGDSSATVFGWLDDSSVIMAGQNQSFVRINLISQERTTIPFVGTEEDLIVEGLQYSATGKALMLMTNKGVFLMRI